MSLKIIKIELTKNIDKKEFIKNIGFVSEVILDFSVKNSTLIVKVSDIMMFLINTNSVFMTLVAVISH